jgi:hypothetical protein
MMISVSTLSRSCLIALAAWSERLRPSNANGPGDDADGQRAELA